MLEADRKQSVQSESAILVGVQLKDAVSVDEQPLTELAGLVETAGAEVVGRLTQRRTAPDKTTYLGKGKLEQLVQIKVRFRIDTHDVVRGNAARWQALS